MLAFFVKSEHKEIQFTQTVEKPTGRKTPLSDLRDDNDELVIDFDIQVEGN